MHCLDCFFWGCLLFVGSWSGVEALSLAKIKAAINYLEQYSLDTVLATCSALLLFSWAFAIPVSKPLMLALMLSSWVFYIVDRLLDEWRFFKS